MGTKLLSGLSAAMLTRNVTAHRNGSVATAERSGKKRRFRFLSRIDG